MRRLVPLIFILTISLPAFVKAQTVATDPVGFTTQACPANSDTLIMTPFIRPAEFIGAVSSATANSLTISGGAFVNNQFVYAAGSQPKTYFALIGTPTPGNLSGRSYAITGNTASTITLNTNGDNVSSVAVGTPVMIIPYHTLSSLFPASDAGISFVASPSSFSPQTKIFIPNYSGTGTNLSSQVSYYFFNGAWRQTGHANTEDHSDDALPNNGYFTLRNVAQATNVTFLGAVLTKRTNTALITKAATQQDNFVSLTRPIDVALNDLGLISGGAFAASPSAFNPSDRLLVFDNNAVGLNKSAPFFYYYFNNAWRKSGQASTIDVGASDKIPSGYGFVIRKAASTDSIVYWPNDPTY